MFVGDPANNFEVFAESPTRLVAEAVQWKGTFSRDKCGRVIELRVDDFDGESRFRPIPSRNAVPASAVQPAAAFVSKWSSLNGDAIEIVMRGSDVAVLYRAKYMTSAEEIRCTLKDGILSGDYYGHKGNFRLSFADGDRLSLTIDPFAEFAPVRNQLFSKEPQRGQKQQLQEERAWADARHLQILSAVENIENPDCQRTGNVLVPQKSEVSFVVPASRECWTLSVALERKIPPIDRVEYPKIGGIHVSGQILVQVTFQNGTEGSEVETGPHKPFKVPSNVLAVRFKSLRKESVAVAIRVD